MVFAAMVLIWLVILICCLVAEGIDTWRAWASQRWVAVPAMVEHLAMVPVELKKGETGRKLEVTYRYAWQGVDHRGSRVTFDDGTESGRIQDSRYQRIHDQVVAQRAAGSLVCWVDPGDPTSAVLVREFRWGQAWLGIGLGILVIAIGGGAMVIGLREYRRERRMARQLVRDPTHWWQADPRWARCSDGIPANRSFTDLLVWLFGCLFFLSLVPLWGRFWVGFEGSILWFIPFIFLVPLIVILPLAVNARRAWFRWRFGRFARLRSQLPLTPGRSYLAHVTGLREVAVVDLILVDLTWHERRRLPDRPNRFHHEFRTYRLTSPTRGEGSSTALELNLPLPSDAPVSTPDRMVDWTIRLVVPIGDQELRLEFPLPVMPANSEMEPPSVGAVGELPAPLALMPIPDPSNPLAVCAKDLERVYARAGLRRIATAGHLRIVDPRFHLRTGWLSAMAIGLSLLATGTGVVLALWPSDPGFQMGDGAGWFTTLAFFLPGLALTGLGLRKLLIRTTWEISPGTITIRTGWWRLRTEIHRQDPGQPFTIRAGDGSSTVVDVSLRWPLVLARDLPQRWMAEAIAEDIRRHLG